MLIPNFFIDSYYGCLRDVIYCQVSALKTESSLEKTSLLLVTLRHWLFSLSCCISCI